MKSRTAKILSASRRQLFPTRKRSPLQRSPIRVIVGRKSSNFSQRKSSHTSSLGSSSTRTHTPIANSPAETSTEIGCMPSTPENVSPKTMSSQAATSETTTAEITPTWNTATMSTPTEKTATMSTSTEKTATISTLTENPATSSTPTENPATSSTPTENPATSSTPTENPATSSTPTEKPATMSTPPEKPATMSTPTEETTTMSTPTENPGTSTTPTDNTATKSTPTGGVSRQVLNGTPGPLSANDNLRNIQANLACSWLRRILVPSLEGRSLLLCYDKVKRLTSSQRNVLSQLIISHELREDESKIISHERFRLLSKAIADTFPSENPVTYYVPYSVDEFNRKHRARGKLYERWNYVRKKLKNEEVIVGRQKITHGNTDSDDENEPPKDPDVENRSRWLLCNFEPWSTTKENIELTYAYRLYKYKHEKDSTIADYYAQIPAYGQPQGFTLIDLDFGQKNPAHLDSLVTYWEDLMPKIIQLGKFKEAREGQHSLFTALGIDLTLEDRQSKVINSLLLIPALLPAVTVAKFWKLTKIECKEAFLLVADTEEEAHQKYEARCKKLAEHNLCPQPTVVLIEGDELLIQVWVKNLKLKIGNVLKAMDICFKMFKILEEPFPMDCVLPFSFLDEYVYKMDSKKHLKYPSLATLYGELNL